MYAATDNVKKQQIRMFGFSDAIDKTKNKI